MEKIISKVNDQKKEIEIYLSNIEKIFSFVGDGIFDIKIITYYNRQVNERINNVSIIFEEKPGKNITKEEWNKLDNIMDNFLNKNGLIDYMVVYSQNQILLNFINKYKLVGYFRS